MSDESSKQSEQAAPRCNIYDCPSDSTHTVPLPASTDTRLSPARRRAATVSLCRPCFTDWQQHLDPNRLRADIDLLRTRPPTGTAAPLTDEAAPPQTPEELVKVLRDEVRFKHEDTPYQLQSRLLIAQQNLARLATLLAERDAAAGDILAALREVLAEVPPMQWLIEQGGLTNEQAPRYARVIGDAYVLLERIDTAAAARGGAA